MSSPTQERPQDPTANISVAHTRYLIYPSDDISPEDIRRLGVAIRQIVGKDTPVDKHVILDGEHTNWCTDLSVEQLEKVKCLKDVGSYRSPTFVSLCY